VWAPSEGLVAASWWRRDAEGTPRPGKTRLLVTSMGAATITRLDEVTLRLRRDGGFFEQEMHQLVRGRSRPFTSGDVVKLSNMTAIVTEVTRDGRPRTVEFRFAAPLESPEWLWMRTHGLRLITWSPPKVGETVVLGAAS
jgi:hypothetical protein